MTTRTTTQLLAALACTAAIGSASADLLFADNFDRGNSSNLNASDTGKSGDLGTLNWVEVIPPNLVGPPAVTYGNASINTNRLLLESGNGSSTHAIPYVDHNFIGLTSLTVSLDFISAPSPGSLREVGFSIGNTKASLDGLTSSGPSIGDVTISFDAANSLSPTTTGINIREDGANVSYTALTLAPGSNVKAVFTFANMNDGTTIEYDVFFNNGVSPIYSGTTTWNGSNENYIAIINTHRNATGDDTFLDNFSVEGTLVPEPGSLALLGLGGMLIARRRRA